MVRHETYAPLGPRVAALPDGPHRLRMTVEWRVIDGTDQQLIGKPPAATGQVTLESTVELLPPGHDRIELVTDESLRPAVERAVKLGPEAPRPESPVALRVRNDPFTGAQLDVAVSERLPIGLAFSVTVRDPAGREFPFRERWIWGTGYAASPGDADTILVAGNLDGLDADRADVLLRPSPDRAAKTPDLTRIWGHEIVLKNVPVQWDPDAPRPTHLPE